MILEIKEIGIEPIITIHSQYNPQGFSGTDLDKNPKNPGIVYPLDNPSNQLSISSIVDHKKEKTRLAHCEARVANTERLSDKTKKIVYTQHICISIVLQREKQEVFSQLAKMLGFKRDEDIGNPRNYIVTSKPITDVSKFSKFNTFKKLLETFNKMSFKADTDLILPNNITRKTYPTDFVLHHMQKNNKHQNAERKSKRRKRDFLMYDDSIYEDML